MKLVGARDASLALRCNESQLIGPFSMTVTQRESLS